MKLTSLLTRFFVQSITKQSPIDQHQVFVGAKALPIELDGDLTCFVIVPQSELKYILPTGFESPILSSLIEEFLHVQLYVAFWKQGRKETHIWWKDQIYNFCRLFFDEYIVGRKKVPILSSFFPPSDLDPDAGLTIFYPNELAPLMYQGVAKIEKLMTNFEKEIVSLDLFWSQLVNIIYRYFFEPLARDAAFRDANTSDSCATCPYPHLLRNHPLPRAWGRGRGRGRNEANHL